jgi:hypothetical protein
MVNAAGRVRHCVTTGLCRAAQRAAALPVLCRSSSSCGARARRARSRRGQSRLHGTIGDERGFRTRTTWSEGEGCKVLCQRPNDAEGPRETICGFFPGSHTGPDTGHRLPEAARLPTPRLRVLAWPPRPPPPLTSSRSLTAAAAYQAGKLKGPYNRRRIDDSTSGEESDR